MIFLSLIVVFYAVSLLYFTWIWKKESAQFYSGELMKVSVVIPFRNEEKQLASLLKSLNKIEYPKELLDFIFVDDHSEDKSLDALKSSLTQFSFKYLVLSLSQDRLGKKEALIEGIANSQADVILTTDADCIIPKNWVKKMQEPFFDSSIQLVSGSVVFTAKTFLSKVFQLEFATLIGVGAISIKMGKYTMANGANLAFRRSTFIYLNPFEDNLHIPTGDDVFLLQKIASEYPQSIYFQKAAVVATRAPENLYVFVNQRIRWASKWKATSDKKNKLPALSVWVFHLIYLIGLVALVKEQQNILFLSAVAGKAIAEYLFINSILKDQQQKMHFLAFCFLQFFYSIYVVLFGLLANFATYQWKGRNFGKYDR